MEIVPSFLSGLVAFSVCDSCCAWIGLYDFKKKIAFAQDSEEELVYLETDF
jgi:hypothetical protein